MASLRQVLLLVVVGGCVWWVAAPAEAVQRQVRCTSEPPGAAVVSKQNTPCITPCAIPVRRSSMRDVICPEEFFGAPVPTVVCLVGAPITVPLAILALPDMIKANRNPRTYGAVLDGRYVEATTRGTSVHFKFRPETTQPIPVKALYTMQWSLQGLDQPTVQRVFGKPLEVLEGPGWHEQWRYAEWTISFTRPRGPDGKLLVDGPWIVDQLMSSEFERIRTAATPPSATSGTVAEPPTISGPINLGPGIDESRGWHH